MCVFIGALLPAGISPARIPPSTPSASRSLDVTLAAAGTGCDRAWGRQSAGAEICLGERASIPSSFTSVARDLLEERVEFFDSFGECAREFSSPVEVTSIGIRFETLDDLDQVLGTEKTQRAPHGVRDPAEFRRIPTMDRSRDLPQMANMTKTAMDMAILAEAVFSSTQEDQRAGKQS